MSPSRTCSEQASPAACHTLPTVLHPNLAIVLYSEVKQFPTYVCMHVCMYVEPSSDAMYCNCTDSNLRGPRSWWVSVSKKSSGAQRSTHVAPEKLDTLVLAVALTWCWLEILLPSLPPIRPSQSRAQTRWGGGSVEEKTAIARAVAGEESSKSLSELRKTKHC